MAEVIDGRRISFSVVSLLHVMLTKESTVTPLYLHVCECLQRRENLHLCVVGALVQCVKFHVNCMCSDTSILM